MESEKDIIEKAKNDPEAFGLLYDEFYEKIFRYIYYRVGNVDLAEDLTAETFFQALKGLWRYQFMNRPFLAWLYKIAGTQVAQYYRKTKKYCELTFDEAPEILNVLSRNRFQETDIHHRLDQKNLLAGLPQALGWLKENEQMVVTLRYIEEKSLDEISTSLGMNLNTVKSHLRRGLHHLQKYYHTPEHTMYEQSGSKKSQTRTASPGQPRG